MIQINKINSIDILSIDSPNGNMLSLDDIENLLTYIDISQNDCKVKGLIITGTGRSFSAGLETSSLIENFSEEKSNYFFKTFDLLLLLLFQFPKPIVAAVNGHSIGGGLLLQCCADYVIIADNPKIKLGLPELRLGLTIDELMKHLLSFNVSNIKSLSKLLYSSEYGNPQKFKEYGYVDEIVSQENVLVSCLSSVNSLLLYDSEAFRITKQMIKADCIENMQRAYEKRCFSIFNELLMEKQSNNDKIS